SFDVAVEYLKRADPPVVEASAEVKRTVSEMLATIERDGMDAIRRYSRELDAWDPASFRVGSAEIEAAAGAVDEELRQHIAAAHAGVRLSAGEQRATLETLGVGARRGVLLGPRHIPVDAVGSYVPSGRYPMLASAFMTVLVPKVAGVERVVACSPP